MKIKEFLPYEGDQEIVKKMNSDKTFVKLREVDSVQVVLGRVTSHFPDVNEEECLRDSVPIKRRKGGGGCVLLFPGVLIITAVYPKNGHLVPLEDFLHSVVNEIAKAIEVTSNLIVERKGMGDLCLNNKKILGSSVYSNRDFVGYYGSLIVEGDLSLIGKYLGAPSKEPEYRRGRNHLDFVTSIKENSESFKKEKFKEIVASNLTALQIK